MHEDIYFAARLCYPDKQPLINGAAKDSYGYLFRYIYAKERYR